MSASTCNMTSRLRPCRHTAFRSARRSLRVHSSYGTVPAALSLDAYVVLGLANCFEKNADGKLVDKFVVEPITAASLECMATGARTCFRHVTGVTLGDALKRDKSTLPKEFEGSAWCDKYEFRVDAAARTWQRTHAQENLMDLVPLGKVRSNWNFDLTDKRVLNLENVVSDEDNIKQDISIDVYGRKEKREAEEAQRQEAAKAKAAEDAKKQQKEDDLDALLLA